MNPQRLQGKTAIVTGGGAGIGAAIVRRFVAEGARVMVGDRDQPRGDALCQELGAATVFHRLDVADAASFAETIQLGVKLWGRLDILVNIAPNQRRSRPSRRSCAATRRSSSPAASCRSAAAASAATMFTRP